MKALPGRHNASNALGCVLVLKTIGMEWKEIEAGFENARAAKGRSEFKLLDSGAGLLADYYNASPASMKAGFLTLQEELQRRTQGELVLVLGDMLELGVNELEFHRELAGPLMALGPRLVLLYGPRMKALAERLKVEPSMTDRVFHFTEKSELKVQFYQRQRPTDLILLKGSRSMKMEDIIRDSKSET